LSLAGGFDGGGFGFDSTGLGEEGVGRGEAAAGKELGRRFGGAGGGEDEAQRRGEDEAQRRGEEEAQRRGEEEAQRERRRRSKDEEEEEGLQQQGYREPRGVLEAINHHPGTTPSPPPLATLSEFNEDGNSEEELNYYYHSYESDEARYGPEFVVSQECIVVSDSEGEQRSD